MNTTEFNWNAMNPFALWRDWVVKSEAQWSEAVSKMLKDDRSGVLTRQLDEARMAHRMFSELAQATLAGANLPSRTDFEALDERMSKIEDALATVSASIVQLRGALVDRGVAIPQPAPARSRKPAPRAEARN